MASPVLILASRSARRAWLLREAGYAFLQIEPPFNDPPQPAEGDPSAVTLALAGRKAASLRNSGILLTHSGGVILGADTVCVGSDGELLGQPQDREDARRMIRSFLNRTHQVVSAVSLLRENKIHAAFADAARVTMGEVSDSELDLYLDTQQWRGKAGAYNLFDRQAAGWPIHVEGDPATVVGLPMRRLTEELRQLSITPTNEHPSQAGVLQA